ncbi:MAG: NuoM family protein [Cyanobacteriota/Melainabacteria group bacterium]|nr:NuoM family protein [Candidatus Obscuribacterales bacterium]
MNDNALYLNILLLLPLLATILIPLVPNEKSARGMAIGFSLAMFVVSLIILGQFHFGNASMQFVTYQPWVTTPVSLAYHVGVDGLSLSMVLLTTFVTLMSVLASYSITKRCKLYYSLVMLLTFSVLGVFVSQNLVQFFVMYELELVPMYFLIAIWGGPRRGYAAMKFLLYTFFGGVIMLAGLLYTYSELMAIDPSAASFNMSVLASSATNLPVSSQSIACLCFFLAFIIKLPSVPFHTWLPDAHVEAPTPISMILAGLLLKMGSYGLVRICMGFFPAFFVEYGPQIVALGAINILWGAIACLVQQDMKRIIAFSSVSHMGFILLGIGSLSNTAVNGAIFQMLSHGFISAMLFFLVGCVYERTHTRLLPEIGGGLAFKMPILFYFWMFATMANLGLPALSGFVGEVTIFYGTITSPMAYSALHGDWTRSWIYLAALGVVLTAGYMLWLLKRLFYGPEQPKWKGHLYDASVTERVVGACLAISILAFGVYPIWLTNLYGSVGDRITASVISRSHVSLNTSGDLKNDL